MSTLLSRAKELLNRRNAGAAIVIVPLAAAAVPAQASSIFTLGTNTVSGNSGGAFGQATSATTSGGEGVHLGGDTLTDQSGRTINLDTDLALTSNTGVVIIDKNNAVADIRFVWSGSFAAGSTVNAGDFLAIAPSIGADPVLSPNDENGSITWTLDTVVTDSSSNVLAEYNINTPQTDTSVPPNAVPFAVGGNPANWTVTLDFQWAITTTTVTIGRGPGAITEVFATFPEDQLVLSPSIDVNIISAGPSGATPVPLPKSGWMGMPILGTMMAAGLLRSRRQAPAPR